MQEYIVVGASGDDEVKALYKLVEKVNEILKRKENRKKYTLQGGTSITFSPDGTCIACQAIVKTTIGGKYEGHA